MSTFDLLLVILVITYSTFASEEGDEFDWESTLEEVKRNKELWDSQEIDTYIYHFQMNAFLPPCYQAPKYVLVEDNQVILAQHDEEYLEENNLNCDEWPINIGDYGTIDDYYEEAIRHLEEGINADCSHQDPFENDSICGGSESFECNQGLYYLTKLKLIYGPTIGNDAGDYTIDCFTSLDDLQEKEYGYSSHVDEECVVDLSLMLQLYTDREQQ